MDNHMAQNMMHERGEIEFPVIAPNMYAKISVTVVNSGAIRLVSGAASSYGPGSSSRRRVNNGRCIRLSKGAHCHSVIRTRCLMADTKRPRTKQDLGM